jgi:hypothetical protein
MTSADWQVAVVFCIADLKIKQSIRACMWIKTLCTKRRSNGRGRQTCTDRQFKDDRGQDLAVLSKQGQTTAAPHIDGS